MNEGGRAENSSPSHRSNPVQKWMVWAGVALTAAVMIGFTQSAHAQSGSFCPVSDGFGPVIVTPLPVVSSGFPLQTFPANPGFGSNPYVPQPVPGFGGYPSGGVYPGFGGNPY